jgi:hypothetical protein
MTGAWEIPELKIRERPPSTLRNVNSGKIREHPPSTLRNVNGGPHRGARAEDLGASIINAKKYQRQAPGKCRS